MSDAETLFEAYRRGVRRYLARIVGHDAATDLTQEVFLRVTRTPVPDAGEAGRRAWVFKIARNLALTFVRDSASRRTVGVDVEAAAPATQELSVAIARALAGLQPVDRDVFLLRESAGLSYADIATSCDLTADAVRARLRRARAELRASLDGSLRVRRDRPLRFVNSEGDER